MSTPPSRFSSRRAQAFMAQSNAPRVFTPAQLSVAMREAGIPMEDSPRPVLRFLKAQAEACLVSRVNHGLYLNRQARPAVMLDEVAPCVRAGAVVSLQTVLGRWGVLNNPVGHLTCVVSGSNVGRVSTQVGDIEFYSMNADLLSKDDPMWQELAFTRGRVATATAEKALLDWLWISGQPASRLSPPPRQDIDLNELDPQSLSWLAQRMGLEDRLEQFRKGPVETAVPTRLRPPR